MTRVNGPNGRDSDRIRRLMLKADMRCHRLQRLPQSLGWHVHERLKRSHRTEARLAWGGGPGPSRRPAGRSRKGQAIVETALLLPILMLLVMGSADLGRVFYYAIAVTNSAREAARQRH